MGTRRGRESGKSSPDKSERSVQVQGFSGMELAGLEPATSWVRSRATFGGDSPWFEAPGYDEEHPEARLLEPPIPLSKQPPGAPR